MQDVQQPMHVLAEHLTSQNLETKAEDFVNCDAQDMLKYKNIRTLVPKPSVKKHNVELEMRKKREN